MAICRALAQDARLIIMDEPTASLTHQEVEGLLHVAVSYTHLDVYKRQGEKNPGEGSEKEPETVYVQAVGAPSGMTAYLLYNGSATYIL